MYRARETERPDALFRDPWARRLAGERGRGISDAAARDDKSEWSLVVRTHLFDELIMQAVNGGADMIVNLAAGLDARPYRLPLPPGLLWVEADLPELLSYKKKVLAGEAPRCALERTALDLTDREARRALFESIAARAARPVIVSEGLLVYLASDDVVSLARDLAAVPVFRRWILDVVSPGLMRLMDRHFGAELARTGSALRFAPEEGVRFFEPHGWRAVSVRSLLKTGAKVRRVPFWLRVLALFPEPVERQGSWPWSGVCLMEKTSSTAKGEI